MAGAGYKLFNTGDVLTAAQVNTYLMEQTVMVFADAAARTTALTGVVSEGMISYLKDTNAVEVYNGSAWVSSDDPNAIQNTIVDAKGDLITATASDVPARLAVGNNGETLVADSSATTGLRWTATPSASNPILNSAMDIWQRGTSVSIAATGAGYTADRWYLSASASNNMTVSRQTTSDTTNLPFIQYCARIQRNSGQTGTGAMSFAQSFETINSIPFAGKTVTYSFYARAGANHSGGALTVYLVGGTGTDQNWIAAGYIGQSTPVSSSATLTTTWQRFTYTGTVGTTVTELTALFQFTPSGTAGANDYWEVTGLQIDIGNTALPFRRSSATLAGELAACQRYFQLIASGTDKAVVNGAMYNASNFFGIYTMKVSMRTTPTLSQVTGTDYYKLFTGTSVTDNFNDITGVANGTPEQIRLDATSNISVTAGYAAWVITNNASSFLALQAEL